MNDLTTKEKAIDSREVAEMVEKRHSDLLESIRTYICTLGESNLIDDFFIKSTYRDTKGETRPCYLLTKKGCDMVVQRMRNNTKSKEKLVNFMNEKFGNKIETLVINSRFETSFTDSLEEALKAFGLEVEYQKQIGSYRLDGYISELNIAIEYDEQYHFIDLNKEKDYQRQREIEDILKCTFVRCDYRDTDSYNIGLIFKKIMEVCK